MKSPFLYQLGSLTQNHLTDLIVITITKSPNYPFSKVIFRGSNCS